MLVAQSDDLDRKSSVEKAGNRSGLNKKRRNKMENLKTLVVKSDYSQDKYLNYAKIKCQNVVAEFFRVGDEGDDYSVKVRIDGIKIKNNNMGHIDSSGGGTAGESPDFADKDDIGVAIVNKFVKIVIQKKTQRVFW